MTTTDWILDITLVLLVLRQLHTARLTWVTVALPVAIVGWVVASYLEAIPTGGNDLWLIGACLAAGTVLGVLGGLATHVWAIDGRAHIKAGPTAAALWVGSMGARLAFIIWITHASGEAALGRFSQAHQLTGADVWQDALVLLAVSEVVVRMGIILVRGVRINAGRGETPAERPRVAV